MLASFVSKFQTERQLSIAERMHLHKYLSILFLLTSLGSCFAATAAAKVETIGMPGNSGVPESVRQSLEGKGYRVFLDDGSAGCDIWLRKSVPSAGKKKEVEGAIFPQLAGATMVGLISFPKPFTDYKGQTIQPGFYTLRYELLPNDGNHLGVAPSRDFLLLLPAASDPDPKVQLSFQELLNLSRRAADTGHPAPLLLMQPGKATPGISQDDQGFWIFSVKLRLSPAEELPLGLVVKGTAPQ